MQNSENLFDINTILRNLTQQVRHVSEVKKIELIFDMHATIPKELRGDNITLEHLLSTLFTFIYKETNTQELVFSIQSVEDFYYEEEVSFIVKESHVEKEKMQLFLKTGLGQDLEKLQGTIVSDEENDVHIKIPFKIGELGFRRHYRLPYKRMLKKKILLILESPKLTQSIAKMFKYFHYDVDMGFNHKTLDLSLYDLVMIEDCMVIENFVHLLKNAQSKKDVKCILLGEEKKEDCLCKDALSMQMIKPITQESIFELIVTLFEIVTPPNEESTSSMATTDNNVLLDLEALFEAHNKALNETSPETKLDKIIENKRLEEVQTLNVLKGKEQAKKMGLVYEDELKNFLNVFDHSDIYFRQIVGEKSSYKIKEFCIDLEEKSKSIGAESMSSFADIVSLIFVYDKLDLLAIYPGRYHIELQKLVIEIERYLTK